MFAAVPYASNGKARKTTLYAPAVTLSALILTVPDPDTMFARAVAAGARPVIAVEEAYGWRLGRVVDPYGHHWEIGRPLAS